MTEVPEVSIESNVEQVPGQLAFEDLMPKTSEKLQTWWHKSRRFVGKMALVGALGFAAGAVVTPVIAPPEIVAGPHDATVNPTLDGQMTLDLGPADTATRPSNVYLGAHVTIKGLHGDGDDQNTGISNSIGTYANLFDPEKIRSDAVNAIKDRAIKGGVWGSFVLMSGFAALYDSYGERRRVELAESWLRHRRQFMPLGLAGSLALGSAGAFVWTESRSSQSAQASAELDGTPFEGWTVHSSLLRSGVAEFVNVLESNERTARAYETNLQKESKKSPILEADKTSFTVVVVGNIKCNMVLPPSMGEVVRESKSTYFIVPGDLPFSGSSFENSCVSSVAFRTKGVNKVISLGNHSSETTEEQTKHEDFTSLNRKPVTIDGRTFLGDDSPRRSAFAQGTTQERRETEREMGQDVANKACAHKEPMFAVIFNEPSAAQPSAERACATLVVAASEESSLVEITSPAGKKTWYFLAGDATGTSDESVNLGNPTDVQEITVLKFSKETAVLKARQTISFYPDHSVEIPQPQLFYDNAA